MLLSAHQPTYFPWMGLFHKIDVADLFIIYDDVEYSRYGWYNRNYILSRNGPILLVVPIIRNFSKKLLHSEVEIDNSTKWFLKHIKSIEQCYSKSPYFTYYIEKIKNILSVKYKFLIDLNLSILNFLLEELNINTDIKLSSFYNLDYNKSDRVLDMSIKTSSTHILFGELGVNYADINKFEKNNIKPIFQKYNHPIYNQFNSKKFFEKMSVIDLLFNCGNDSKDILLNNNYKKKDFIPN